MIRDDLQRWLLEAETPSIRYLALRDLMDRPETDPEVRKAREEMASTGIIPHILSKQKSEGYWFTRHNYYSPKYRSTHWSLHLLNELAIDGESQNFRKGADFMLTIIGDTSPGAIKMGKIKAPCFLGNLLRYVGHAGLILDPRVRSVINDMEYRALETEWVCPGCDFHCVYGVIRGLWGMAALPDELRTREVEDTISSGLKFLLEDHHIIEGPWERFRSKSSLEHWKRLNFPDFATSDPLFVLRVLDDLGELGNPGARPAIEWLNSRRLNKGTWKGASPYKRRTWKGLGGRSEIDRWVTLHAELVMRRASES